MRLFHTFDDQKQALQFSTFLTKEGIENQCEITANKDWGSSDYGTVKCTLWIIDEDQVAPAQKWLDEFEKNPQNPLFAEPTWKTAIPDPIQALKEMPTSHSQPTRKKATTEKTGLGYITLYLFILCIVLSIYGHLTSPVVEGSYSSLPEPLITLPPIYKQLIYDYPHNFEIFDKLLKAYDIEKLKNLADLPSEGRVLLEKFYQTPFWEGLYAYAVDFLKYPSKPLNYNVPMFEKIQEGEYWRIFTPILLHANILHLFFNIIWLIVLGKLIEDRIGSWRFLLFILITAAFSNTAQYLMSGPLFLGLSGVICAMFGFIWARQRHATWENYTLMPGVLSFMFIFIGAVAVLQLILFFLQVYKNLNIMSGIANTAHFSGALIGYILGRLNFFAARPS